MLYHKSQFSFADFAFFLLFVQQTEGGMGLTVNRNIKVCTDVGLCELHGVGVLISVAE